MTQDGSETIEVEVPIDNGSGVLSIPYPPYQLTDVTCSDSAAQVFVALEASTAQLVVIGAQGSRTIVTFSVPA